MIESPPQMEGAATTRAVAKEMLKNGMSPRDKSQQMISNNYKTICYIVEHKDEPLTPENIRLIHSAAMKMLSFTPNLMVTTLAILLHTIYVF